MALLASSWLLVESFIIPNGYRKWFYLSFYIHPAFLVLCQLLLWFKKLQKLFLLLILFTFRVSSFLGFFIFRFFNKTAKVSSFSSTKYSTKVEVFYDAMEPEIIQETTYLSYEVVEELTKDICVKNSWLNTYLYSDHYNSLLRHYDLDSIVSSSTNFIDDPDLTLKITTKPTDLLLLSNFEISGSDINQELADSETRFSQSCGNHELSDEMLVDLPLSGFGVEDSSSATDLLVNGEYLAPVLWRSYEPENMDLFHQKYLERMKFFEALYDERLYGLNVVSNEHLTSPGLFMTPESSTNSSMQFISWSKMAKTKLMRSLECEFELIYVAQLCLSWEALHHQYQKVEALNCENILFHHSVAEKFQEFQILLERFVEDQKIEGQKYSNYAHQRLPFQGQLRVPDVTSFMVEEKNNSMGGEAATKATQVLRSIEKCIKALWLYLKTDNKKSLWKYKGILRSSHHPPVENPTDLELLYNVTKSLHKKALMFKDLQGKKKCWVRRRVRVVQFAENEKRNLLFAMIDIKLVQRMLKMTVISSSQLNWCQQKLNNLEFKQGQLFRGTTSHLFPS